MADQWAHLLDELSSAKQTDITREEWRSILRKALIFLIELLQSIDKTKLS